MTVRIDRIQTAGASDHHESAPALPCNSWIVGDDEECIIIDPGADPDTVLDLVGRRETLAIICTHAHLDHTSAVPELTLRTNATVYLHPDALDQWREVHPRIDPEGELADGQRFEVGDATLEVLETPGHAPGTVCLWAPELRAVFTGDTLLASGPYASPEGGSDYSTMEYSVRKRLFPLGDDAVIKPGRGEDCTIANQRAEQS